MLVAGYSDATAHAVVPLPLSRYSVKDMSVVQDAAKNMISSQWIPWASASAQSEISLAREEPKVPQDGNWNSRGKGVYCMHVQGV
jgi:hypothetical protein